MTTDELTVEEAEAANDLIKLITKRQSSKHMSTNAINIGGQEDAYRPLVKALREQGHTVLVGNGYVDDGGMVHRYVSSGQKESKFSENTNW